MLKCLECGHIFEEGERHEWKETRGEYWGQPAHETVVGCPRCGGAYEETKLCAVCESEQLDEDLYGGICKSCLAKYENDLDTCLKLGAIDKEEVEINSLLVTMFTAAEIEEMVEKTFEGSLPAFIAAFTKHQKISEAEIDAVQQMIDRYRKGES